LAIALRVGDEAHCAEGAEGGAGAFEAVIRAGQALVAFKEVVLLANCTIGILSSDIKSTIKAVIDPIVALEAYPSGEGGSWGAD
jgi:hypothetical protein